MIEQDFNIGSDNAATMLVNNVMQFFLYFSKAVENSMTNEMEEKQETMKSQQPREEKSSSCCQMLQRGPSQKQ